MMPSPVRLLHYAFPIESGATHARDSCSSQVAQACQPSAAVDQTHFALSTQPEMPLRRPARAPPPVAGRVRGGSSAAEPPDDAEEPRVATSTLPSRRVLPQKRPAPPSGARGSNEEPPGGAEAAETKGAAEHLSQSDASLPTRPAARSGGRGRKPGRARAEEPAADEQQKAPEPKAPKRGRARAGEPAADAVEEQSEPQPSQRGRARAEEPAAAADTERSDTQLPKQSKRRKLPDQTAGVTQAQVETLYQCAMRCCKGRSDRAAEAQLL
jgi:hypothetical protein